MPLELDAIGSHCCDLLPGLLIIKVDFHVCAGHGEPETVQSVIAGEERTGLFLYRVLQFTCMSVPMIDDTITSYTHQGPVSTLLPELIFELDTLLEWRSKLDTSSGCAVGALQSNVTTMLAPARSWVNKAYSAISITYRQIISLRFKQTEKRIWWHLLAARSLDS